MNEQVKDYIEKYPGEIIEMYNNLRKLIFDSVLCKPEEKLWAKLPSYYVGESFVRLIPFKDHINIEAQAVIQHKEELTGYKITPKGMVQIYLKQDIPYEVLKKIFAEELNIKMLRETERLIITRFDLSMAEAVHKNSLDEDNRRFVPDEVFETVEEARETIDFLISCYESGEGPLVYPVLLQDGTNIGYVQLVPIAEGAEVGYHIAKEFTGKGYATEALKVFVDYVKAEKGLEKIYGICVSENVASKRVLEKCGFKKEYEGIGDYQGKSTEIAKYVLVLN